MKISDLYAFVYHSAANTFDNYPDVDITEVNMAIEVLEKIKEKRIDFFYNEIDPEEYEMAYKLAEYRAFNTEEAADFWLDEILATTYFGYCCYTDLLIEYLQE